jgi:hypothetical protein
MDEDDLSYDFSIDSDEGDSGYGDWRDYELDLGEYGYDISPGGNFDVGYIDTDLEKLDPNTLDLGGLSWGSAKNVVSKLGSGAVDLLKKAFTDKDGNINWRNVIGTGAGILSATGAFKNTPQPRGYQGKIPTYQAVRSPVAGAFTPTKPGEAARRYFSDIVYAAPGKAAEAQAAANKQAEGLAALNRPVEAAAGGLMALKTGHYLRGGTDGMADKLRTTIDDNQPAALSHGEFIIPADVVSHLGNGNSEAGAQRLYAMMDKVRQARTGTKKQGKQIDPNKYMPA